MDKVQIFFFFGIFREKLNKNELSVKKMGDTFFYINGEECLFSTIVGISRDFI